MNEEKKYSIVGRVEIGTDEYRDLIEGLAEAKKDYSDADHKRWEEYRRANTAEEKVKELTEKYAELRAFIDSDETVATKLQLFRLKKMSEATIYD